MKLQIIGIVLGAIGITFLCNARFTKQAQTPEDNSGPTVKFVNDEANQEVDVMIDGKLFTSYCYSDTLMKQILYPVLTPAGTPVTRGWPIKPRPGETTDHPHHRGMWLNYGDVDGYDFWGNSYEIEDKIRKVHDGRINHVKIEQLSPGTGKGSIVTDERWVDPSGKQILGEKTKYVFMAQGSTRIIDRVTTLTAMDSAVTFDDTKEGMFAIRYNHHLKLPSKKPKTFKDAMGNETTVTSESGDATGNYRSSEGDTGLGVWGTRAKWMDLYGTIGDEKVSLVICDHPKNFDYPTYWHARGYGLFSANPFGAHDFTKGKLTIDYTLPAGQSITFRYRVIISSGAHLTDRQIEMYASKFAEKY